MSSFSRDAYAWNVADVARLFNVSPQAIGSWVRHKKKGFYKGRLFKSSRGLQRRFIPEKARNSFERLTELERLQTAEPGRTKIAYRMSEEKALRVTYKEFSDVFFGNLSFVEGGPNRVSLGGGMVVQAFKNKPSRYIWQYKAGVGAQKFAAFIIGECRSISYETAKERHLKARLMWAKTGSAEQLGVLERLYRAADDATLEALDSAFEPMPFGDETADHLDTSVTTVASDAPTPPKRTTIESLSIEIKPRRKPEQLELITPESWPEVDENVLLELLDKYDTFNNGFGSILIGSMNEAELENAVRWCRENSMVEAADLIADRCEKVEALRKIRPDLSTSELLAWANGGEA